MGEIFNLQVIMILLAFLGFILLIIFKKLPTLLALPILGIIIAVISGVPFKTPLEDGGQTIMGHVIGAGSIRLAGTMMSVIYGAMFARTIQKQGISDSIIRKSAELAGDRPIVIAIFLTLATAITFSAIGGAGAVIMVSTIVVPLMLSAGISSNVSASLVLMGIGLGGLFNVSNYQFYIDTIGMDIEIVKSSSLVIGIASAIITLLYIIINVKNKEKRALWATPTIEKPKKNVGTFALLSPLVPIILVFVFKFSAETSLLIAIIYTILVTKPKQILQIMSSSLIEGIQDVAGVIGLMIGIGILLNGVSSNETIALMQPLISQILPKTPFLYIIVFTVCAPLALYRGPLNLYGLGSGIANVMLQAGTLSPVAIGMALRCTGVVQGISDPTNTQNVIVADFAKTDVNSILKSTILYTMAITFVSLIYTAVVLL